MSRSWWAKCFLLGFIVVLSGIYVYPTLSNLDPDTTKFPFKQKINLGLDLQGGLYLVLGVDFNKVFKDVVERQAASLGDRMKEKTVPVTSVRTSREGVAMDDPRILVAFDPARRTAVYDLI